MVPKKLANRFPGTALERATGALAAILAAASSRGGLAIVVACHTSKLALMLDSIKVLWLS